MILSTLPSNGSGKPLASASAECSFGLLLKDRLCTRNMLRSKNLKLENLNRVLCPGNAEETAQHIFQDCTFAKTKPVGGILNFTFQTNQPLPLLIEGFKQHFFAPFFLEIFILIVLEYLGSEKRRNFQRKTSIKQLQKSLHSSAKLVVTQSQKKVLTSSSIMDTNPLVALVSTLIFSSLSLCLEHPKLSL